MLLWLCKGQELPVFAYVSIMKQPILLKSRVCVRPYCLIRERNGMEYWSHQQTYVSTGFGDLSFAPCPRLNLDKPGERPTRFNSKRQECFLGTRLLLLHSRADTLVVSRRISTLLLPGPLGRVNIKPFSLISSMNHHRIDTISAIVHWP